MRLGPDRRAVVREILPKEQLLFQAELGVHLDDAEARAFAFACRHGRLRPHDVRAVTGLSGAGALAVLDRLAIQALISPLEGAETPVFVLAGHLGERVGRTERTDDLVGAGASGLVADQAGLKPGRLVTDQARSGQEDLSTAQATRPSGSLVTDQAGLEPGRLVTDQAPVSVELDDVGWKVVAFCDVPRSMAEIMSRSGLTHCTFFRRNHLEPPLAGGVLRMTHPDQPNHPDQAYVLTEAGLRLKARRVNEDAGTGNGDRTNGA